MKKTILVIAFLTIFNSKTIVNKLRVRPHWFPRFNFGLTFACATKFQPRPAQPYIPERSPQENPRGL